MTLASPVYDKAAGTVTYDVTLLDNFENFRLLHKVAGLEDLLVLTPDNLPGNETLQLVSLMIDDCANYVPNCYLGEPLDMYCTTVAVADNCGSAPSMAMCWVDAPCSYCEPCRPQNGCGTGCGTMDGTATGGCYDTLNALCDNSFQSCCYENNSNQPAVGGCSVGCYGE